MASDHSVLKRLIAERVEDITKLAQRIPSPHPIGIVRWFAHELSPTGALASFHYDLVDKPVQGRLNIQGTVGNSRILLSDDMLDLFANFKQEMGGNDEYLKAAIENFVVHEIVHRAQGMGEGNHRTLSAVGPNVLAALDYEADACAVLILSTMRLVEFLEGVSNLDTINNAQTSTLIWRAYAAAILSTLFQIHTFSLMGADERPITKVAFADKSIGVPRWERICAWHMQYHRARNFNIALPLADFQILFKPVIGFRNQDEPSSSALKALKRDWPEFERNSQSSVTDKFTDMAPIALSGVGYDGVRVHVKYDPKPPAQYDSLFAGIFDCDVEESAKFFDPFLFRHPEFTGQNHQPPPSERWDFFHDLGVAPIVSSEFSPQRGNPAVQATFKPRGSGATGPTSFGAS
jgi:hypothetical protein